MQPTFACLASSGMYRPIPVPPGAESLGRRTTPFGDSGEIHLVRGEGVDYYVVARYVVGSAGGAPAGTWAADPRATLYALKDLGVQRVLGWAPVSAITHDIAVGDLVLPVDVIDQTTRRPKTMCESSPLGALRQFPVFCPGLRDVAADVLHDRALRTHDSPTAAVLDGPRMATAAEIRFLGHVHVHLTTHAFVPEAFLAKELELCFAALGYVASYAETGSTHRPFAGANLFTGLTHESAGDRLAAAIDSRDGILRALAARLAETPRECPCPSTMAEMRQEFGLPDDWHTWFA